MKCFSLGRKSATIKSHCLNTVAHFRSNLNYCIHYKTVKKYDILYNLPYRVVSIYLQLIGKKIELHKFKFTIIAELW